MIKSIKSIKFVGKTVIIKEEDGKEIVYTLREPDPNIRWSTGETFGQALRPTNPNHPLSGMFFEIQEFLRSNPAEFPVVRKGDSERYLMGDGLWYRKVDSVQLPDGSFFPVCVYDNRRAF